MFDPNVEVVTAAQLCDRIAATHATLREAECEELVLAAAWADVHYLDTTNQGTLALGHIAFSHALWEVSAPDSADLDGRATSAA